MNKSCQQHQQILILFISACSACSSVSSVVGYFPTLVRLSPQSEQKQFWQLCWCTSNNQQCLKSLSGEKHHLDN